ncbi:aminopeptidase [Chitinophaga caeni]|uniref:Aminopeptidase n=1 Tax=Chitinophaga caeni TaxID=2029983 RepID=A0A291QZT9_9BACT|nr:C1 family peptidase [Chitinophaga caeni]ATL49445.1 aminopeptidase [Chitinophaga caeni]
MKRILFICFLLGSMAANAQEQPGFLTDNAVSPIKNQQQTGTCWCFSTTSLLESQYLKDHKKQDIDISEMFTVRNTYLDKGRNYILRQGHAQFSEGGLGHDVIHTISRYGAVPESAYTGLTGGAKFFNHSKMAPRLQNYLDSILKLKKPLPDWEPGFNAILDEYMGKAPATFDYNGKQYNPKSFAAEVLHFNADDYVGFTSFTHHPYNQNFIVEVPDNFSNGSYYNVPLNELIQISKEALKKGYTIMWDADVSNRGFAFKNGYALAPKDEEAIKATPFNPDVAEKEVSPEYRQKLYEELITQDDHLMHITGLAKDKSGKEYFVVKNSWGEQAGPFKGYVYVSEPYFAVNTITIVIPKSALPKSWLKKHPDVTTTL